MSKKIFLITAIFFCFHVESQNSMLIEESETISNQLYTKCFENLNQGSKVLEKYQAFKDAKNCSIMYCMALLQYQEKDLKGVAEERLRGITTQLFREGNPIYLICGMDSYLRAKEQNENLEDDNHIVYISIAACMISPFEARAQEIVDEQTMLLIDQNSIK
jgi:hypothetical protein